MNRFITLAFAICTVCTGAGVISPASATTDAAANIAGYERSLVQWGATSLPLPAQLQYRAAIIEAQRGNAVESHQHLERAIALDPDWPDPYFTLSWTMFRKFDPDALYYLVGGFRAVFQNFHAQSLLAVNAFIIVLMMLVAASIILCLAFAVRYLPFVAHRISEVLEERVGAGFARATANLIVLVPFVLFPGFVTGFCFLLVMTWPFMARRERFLMTMLIMPFVTLGMFASQIERYGPVADPSSFTALATQSVSAAGDAGLVRETTALETPGLDTERHNVLGLLHQRQENYDVAAEHFLAAIAASPDEPMAYVNLGNVYYLRGMYEKALEGYRKAEQLAPIDAVGQYNLAQAYIKTLLMAESSKALRGASAAGIDRVTASFASVVRPNVHIYPKTFAPFDLWRIARTEGATRPGHIIDSVLVPVTRFSVRLSAWFMLGALLIALIVTRSVKKKHLSFQCANCGELTSEATCTAQRGTFICHACGEAIDGVSSDKVIEALLRQRRQSVLVRRRRAIRFITTWIPGMRDAFYGRLTRGLFLALLFSFSLIQLWSKGYVIKDWYTFDNGTPLWKWIMPALGLGLTYAVSIFSKRYFEVRNYRTPSLESSHAPGGDHPAARRASA